MNKYRDDERRFLLSPRENERRESGDKSGPSGRKNVPGKAGLIKDAAWYAISAKKIAQDFKVNPNNGLSEKQVKHRLKHYGKNNLPEAPPPSLFKIFWRQLTDFMILILLAAAIASMVIQDWIESFVLFAVVITNVAIGVTEEWKAEKALAELKQLTVPTATVLRNGDREVVQAAEVVLGDIILLEEGARVPADLRLIETVNLQLIESMLTGESEPVDKTSETLGENEKIPLGDLKNMAFMGTNVARGRGKGIVISTGKRTEMGKISKSLTSPTEEKTRLQIHLKKLGKILVILSIVLCTLVVGIGFLRVWMDTGEITHKDILGLIKVGVSLAVSVIPEGLVAVVTVTMAFGVSRMAKRNAVVRKLPAVETLGSVTTICADKTGTLTEGLMKAQELWIAGETYQVTGRGNTPEGSISRDGKEFETAEEFPEPLRHTLKVLSLCNNAEIQKAEMEEEWEAIGDPTEVALLVVGYKGYMAKDNLLQDYTFIHEAPFDSTRNRMTVVYSLNDTGDSVVLSKGAPTTLLNLCTSVYWGNSIVKMTEEFNQNIERKSEKMASIGMRVLALAFKSLDLQSVQKLTKGEDAEKELVFLGLVGLFDPPRKGVREEIQICKDCGITVHMITGDHPLTAKNIATRLGIIENDEEIIMTGADIDSMSTKQISELPHIPNVFARVSPENKQKIVQALKLRGEVVAMTGDGVNDAPAIKQANVAVAMGSGTDLTKQVADVVLIDNNFTSIVVAIEEGRRIYDNIQKFILYLLSCNSSEIYIMLAAVALGLPIPFTPVMILWANLIVDIPPALALGIDPVSRDALHRKPRKPNTGIFTWKSFLIILFQGLSMSALTLGIYTISIFVENYNVEPEYDKPSHARGLAFITLGIIQLIHAFLSRSPRETAFNKDFFNNKWLLIGVGGSIFLLVLASYIPGVKGVLNQYPLTWFDWIKIGICVLIHVALVEICKLVIRIISKKKGESHSENREQELFYEDV